MVDTMAPPCVLVLDVMLPFVGGFELVDRDSQQAGVGESPHPHVEVSRELRRPRLRRRR